jgi:hypothetical protein
LSFRCYFLKLGVFKFHACSCMVGYLI